MTVTVTATRSAEPPDPLLTGRPPASLGPFERPFALGAAVGAA
ncbi:hypothetical protein GA0070618_4912 [Micromonospora echinospora]|uniref:Uncharacterized protein n=1 Tax=Micromonospora echinospora TaxID=1877 RepID=A0A1C4Z8G4_MICEC|nr:hypothetical protein GA0070618_4912 [Micromonospora echinospora]